MKDSIGRVLRRGRVTFDGFTTGQKAVAVLGSLALLLGGFMVFRWASTPDYGPLYSNLSASDASVAADQNQFGTSLSMSGGILAVGMPGFQDNRGAVLMFGVASGAYYGGYLSGDPAVGDYFGTSVAISGAIIMAGNGTLNYTRHAVSYFDIYGGFTFRSILPPDLVSTGSRQFGGVLALSTDFVVIGDLEESTLGPQSGAAYIVRNLATQIPGVVLAQKGSIAPEVPNATFATFSSFQVNQDDKCALMATLAGAGAAGGRSVGLWSELQTLGFLRLHQQINATSIDGFTSASIAAPVLNDPTRLFWNATVKGTGITAANDQRVLSWTGLGHSTALAEGSPFPASNDTKIKSIAQFTRNNGASSAAGTRSSGTTTVTAANDSAVWSTFILENNRSAAEGQGVTGSGDLSLGQIAPRSAPSASATLFTAAVTGATTTAATNAGLFVLTSTGDRNFVRRKGESFSGVGPITSFLGESAGDNLIARVGVGGVPAARNEGLLYQSSVGANAAYSLPKDAAAEGYPAGCTFASFLRYWLTPNGFVLLATVKGPGVTAANDTALYYFQVNNNLLQFRHLLMREGDPAPDGLGAKVGVIQQVDVNRGSGSYTIIASLTGAGSDASNNLALFKGQAPAGVVELNRALTAPFLHLRKGTLHQVATDLPAVITSMKLTLPVDATGAGNRGLGGCVGSQGVAVLITLKDGRVVAALL